MTKTRRCVGLVALALIAAAVLFAGCGGGGDGGNGVATGSVSGTITYAATGNPLGGITVAIGGISTTTNANGQFTLNGVPAGAQVLQITADAARDLVIPPGVPLAVDVTAGGTTQLPAPVQMVDDVDSPPEPPS